MKNSNKTNQLLKLKVSFGKMLLALLLLSGSFVAENSSAQNTFPSSGAAGIGTASPNSSSLLDIVSTSKGLLIPRMTKTQRDAIASPVEGLMIYQTNSMSGFYYYDGSAWNAVTPKGGANKTLSNLTDPTAVNVDLLPAADYAQSLGSTVHQWDNLYLLGSVYLGGTRFLGSNAGTGLYNTNVGGDAGISNSTGSGNTATGHVALYSTTTGSNNTATGNSALYSNTTGSSNVAAGVSALYTNVGGSHLVAVGDSALYNQNGGGAGNTAVGSKALFSNTTGNANTAVGFNSLFNNITGQLCTGVGDLSLYANTTGKSNTAVGNEALSANTTGSSNSAFGDASLWVNTSGNYNVACGSFALASNTTGSYNIASGISALAYNSTGSANSAFGEEALVGNTTGHSNVAVGMHALFGGTIQSNIVAVGDSALYNNGGSGSLDGTANAALGSKALFSNTTGRANSAVGFQSSYSTTTGIHNTSCGYKSLYTNTTGNDNTTVGYSADIASAALSNATAIGSSASVSVSNCVVLGNSSVTKIGVGTTPGSANVLQFAVTTAKLTTGGVWTNASDRKLKDRFEKLDSKNILDKVNALDIERWHYIADGEPSTHISPIAQDFHEAFGVGDDTTISTIDPSGVALLAIQELSRKNDEKDAEIAQQQKQIDDLRNMVLDMQQSLSQCCSSYQSSLANKNAVTTSDVPKLEQNIPNPFDNSTLIPFRIPKDCKDASIIITNTATSQVISVIPISCNEDHISIDVGTLASGTYSYTLYVDGKMIDTKSMIIAK